MEALGLSTTVAQAVAPQAQQAAVAAASQLASSAIDGTVAVFNAAGLFQKSTPTVAAPPVAVPAMQFP
jgi:hypothetical protein